MNITCKVSLKCTARERFPFFFLSSHRRFELSWLCWLINDDCKCSFLDLAVREVEKTAYAVKAWTGLIVVKWALRPTAFKREVYSAAKLEINVNQNYPLATVVRNDKQLLF